MSNPERVERIRQALFPENEAFPNACSCYACACAGDPEPPAADSVAKDDSVANGALLEEALQVALDGLIDIVEGDESNEQRIAAAKTITNFYSTQVLSY